MRSSALPPVTALATDVLVFIGSDTPNNQPVTTKYMYYAKKHGTKIVVINPFREPGLERLARGVEPRYLDVARSFGASRRAVFWKVLLPALYPYLITGARIGLVHAIRAMVVAEMLTCRFGWILPDADTRASRLRVRITSVVTSGRVCRCM